MFQFDPVVVDGKELEVVDTVDLFGVTCIRSVIDYAIPVYCIINYRPDTSYIEQSQIF